MNDDASSNALEFHPIAIGAHYPSAERGLTADALATRALAGRAYTVCTAHVVASHGRVTDVLDVPTDTINAQLEHIFETGSPEAACVSVTGHPATVSSTFRLLEEQLSGPFVLNLTLSGPSGEDIVSPRGFEALTDRLGQADLVTLHRIDAERVAGMEIPSLDDAQVAVQRLSQLGAEKVLLRCGQISTHHFDLESPPPDYAVDLYYDGEEFALFEAPYLDLGEIHGGASSALVMAILKALTTGKAMQEAIREAKAFVTEALRRSLRRDNETVPHYFWQQEQRHDR